ncbi:MAG TPA: hypothetical protein VGM50_19255 [Gemmatimonadaceae bacterium]|jgi:hypothetical protein
MLIAIAAVFTSVVAVALGAYSAYLQRAHDRAEVWPRVEIGLWESPKVAVIQVLNTGIGPARIESFDVCSVLATDKLGGARAWSDGVRCVKAPGEDFSVTL